ncbi:uncharacterized protein I206_102200 [Kwoniella pini CBS 10737]|uniref:Protein YOP1 n=1 Tax=Kwoniella pini CBS 10737 TaxID=1296096 RepID=A0A1B9HST0_9TREE|nr:uncharacterized protein I206_07568 [Kwoniella pini CBS 10737]OCF46335.1 hypothetical protein I206_07568 [Kwoniella pini CBS 10737]
MVQSAEKQTYSPVVTRCLQYPVTLSDWMDDERMSHCSILMYMSERLDRPPSVLAKAAIIFYISVIILNPSNQSLIFVNILGLLPAAYNTLNHLWESDTRPNKPGLKKKENEMRIERTRRWLDYWIIFGTSCMIESSLGEESLLSLIPFWYVTKSIWIIWFLITLLNNDRGKAIRPEPLKLRPRSILASRDPSTPDTKSPEVTPSPSTAEYQNELDYTSGSKDSLESFSSKSSSLVSSEPISPDRLDSIRQELRDKASPALSVTPVNYREGRIVTPFTGISSAHDATDESTNSSPSSDGSHHHDTEQDDIGGEDEDGQGDRSDQSSSSDEPDESDVVILPPDTPLDELALRGKKTIELSSPTNSDSSESTLDEDRSEGAINQMSVNEEKVAASEHVESEEGATAFRPSPALRMSDMDENYRAPLSPPKNPELDVTLDRDDIAGADNQLGNDIVISTKEAVKPIEIGKVDVEPEVVKLSIEDLLAMDQEGGQQIAQNEHRQIGENGKLTAPLKISKPSNKAE